MKQNTIPSRKKRNYLLISLIAAVVLLSGTLAYLLITQHLNKNKALTQKDTSPKSLSARQIDSLARIKADSLSVMIRVDTLFEKSKDKQSSMTKGEMWWCNLGDEWKEVFRKKMSINEDIFPSNQQLALLFTTMQDLDISGKKKITHIKPLAMFANLKKLNCSDIALRDLEPLKTLTRITDLNIASTQITNLAPISGLTTLKILNLSNANVSDLSPIKHIKSLEKLDCSINHVTDLEPIKDLSLLMELNCSNNPINSLKSVGDLINLKSLNCSNTKVSNLMPLFNLSQLEVLYCFNTQIGSLDPLYNLDKLKIFYYNNIQDKEIEDFKNANPDCTVLLRKK